MEEEGRLVPQSMEQALMDLPDMDVPAEEKKHLINGVPHPLMDLVHNGAFMRVYCGGQFCGIGHGEIRDEGPCLKMDLLILEE
jgi:hypothetical protein